MEHFQNNELEYVVDDYYDVSDFDDDDFSPQSVSNSIDNDSVDSDFEDDFELSKPKTDTSALEARNGKDIQGIPWERLNFTREKYRESRLKQYKNYENLSRSREDLEKECKEVEKGHTFYDFQFNTRMVKSTIVHFQVLSNLKGHLDYSFASAWHPNGQILATGNQDTTCRLWDVRNLSESFAVLKGRMGAIRAIRFSSDGQFMAMTEPADFVHIFDAESDYAHGQEIDLFGEIAGISFSPDGEALFVGVADRTYGSLLEFNRKHYDHQYLNCMF